MRQSTGQSWLHRTPIQVSSNSEQLATSLCRQSLEHGAAVVLVPGLLALPVATIPAADTPNLSRMLSASEQLDCLPVDDFESLLIASVIADQRKTCAASLAYAFEFGDGSDNVLFVDPAYQQIDMNNATLAAPGVLSLEADEAEALLLTLNQHFAADGLRFEQKNPQRWYCHFDNVLDIHTTPVSAAIDRDVAECRPTGKDSRAWRSKLAEIEMLLFEHAVNSERQMRGLLPVNTLWLWGEGNCVAQASPVVDIVSDNLYAESLASHLGLTHYSVQQLQNADNITRPVIYALQQFEAVTDDIYTESVKKLDSSLGDILWSQYQSGRLPEILIWCGRDQLFHVPATTGRVRGITRWVKSLHKPKPLSAYVQQNSIE